MDNITDSTIRLTPISVEIAVKPPVTGHAALPSAGLVAQIRQRSDVETLNRPDEVCLRQLQARTHVTFADVQRGQQITSHDSGTSYISRQE